MAAASPNRKDPIILRETPRGVGGYELLFGRGIRYPSGMLRSLLFALIFVFIFLSPVPAQQNSPSTSTSSTAAKSFDPAQATQAWLDTVPADTRAKSDAYFEGGYWLLLWNFLVTAGIAIFLLA